MATINDIHAELVTVNATLSSLGANINAGTAATNAVKGSVDQLDADLIAGFAQANTTLNAVAASLNAITVIGIEELKLLFHMTKQNETMICALEHISENTCAILTQTTIQTRLQTETHDDVAGLFAIAQSAYPAAALERERLQTLRAEIHKCCPPEERPPACTYRPCADPGPIEEPKLPPLPEPPRPPG